MAYGVVNADKLSGSNGGSISPDSSVFRNRIINGAMVIDQRSAGASTTVTANGYYSCDRWLTFSSQSSKYSIQQNAGAVTPPSGFSNYIGVTSLSAYSITSTDYFVLIQKVEGYNIADLAWGTASAATITLSFWVRSSLTGTFGGALRGGTGEGRSYPFTYTISAANTWEQKSVTIAGDTTSTWASTNSSGVQVQFGLGVGTSNSGTAGSWQASGLNSATGATSVVGTSGATFYITGVQLEKGSTATSFDYRPYGQELSLCYRYFQRRSTEGVTYGQIATGGLIGSNTLYQTINLLQTMRVAPSMSSSAANTFSVDPGNTPGTGIAFERINTNTYRINVTTAGNANSVGQLFANGSATAYIDASAEL